MEPLALREDAEPSWCRETGEAGGPRIESWSFIFGRFLGTVYIAELLDTNQNLPQALLHVAFPPLQPSHLGCVVLETWGGPWFIHPLTQRNTDLMIPGGVMGGTPGLVLHRPGGAYSTSLNLFPHQ